MILKSTKKTYLFSLSFLIDTKHWAKIWERIKNKKSRAKNILKAISSGKVFLFKSKWISSFEAFQIGQRLLEDKYLTNSFIKNISFLTQDIWMILPKIYMFKGVIMISFDNCKNCKNVISLCTPLKF